VNDRLWRLMALLVVVFGLSGQALAAQTSGMVAGRVVDALTGDALAGVEVVAEGLLGSVLTDDEGRFTLAAPADRPITLRFHLDGHQELRLEVTPGRTPEQVTLEALVFELAPIEVEVNPSGIDRRRASGSSARIISRLEIVQSIGSSIDLGDVLRRHVPSLRVRETHTALLNPLGREVCLEFRGAASRDGSIAGGCRSPLIVVDGVRMAFETTVLQSLPLEDIAEVEVLPPSDAGTRYGPGAADGAIVIRTLRGAMGSGNGGFNWRLDPEGHPTWKVFAGSTIGYAAGFAAGLSLGRRCLSQSNNHQIESSCETGGTLGSVAAMVLLPSFGAAIGARLTGTTDLSRGRFVPSVVGAAVTIGPAYLFTTLGGSAEGMELLGTALLAVGVPLTVTVVDKLFRRLR
jgi:hypothetical protein